jgi:membrane protease YdiL (CAAX protease family)
VTPLDDLLTACLLLLVPGYMLWRSLTGKKRPPDARTARYRRGIAIAAALLAMLAAAWIPQGRSAAALGLELPLSRAGLIGLAIAAVLLLGLFISMRLAKRRAETAPDSAEAAILPETPAEWRLFVVSMLIVTPALELLYRGYLVWAIEPRFGTVLAVLLPATAYGAAHGYHGWRRFAGSLVSALLFTLGFVLTRSLWWLVLIHAGLPTVVALAQRRLSRTPG